MNNGTFEKDQEIMNFIKSNPECFAKVWELMMLNDRRSLFLLFVIVPYFTGHWTAY